MIRHFLMTGMAYALVVLPLQVIGYPLVAILLLTKWNARSTWWGNAKHGKGESRGCDTPWKQYLWLVWRNPVNNLLSFTLAAPCVAHVVNGDATIDDDSHGGFYSITTISAWEYYWIKPYTLFESRRCIRMRLGWKINGKQPGDLCEFVLTLNPVKQYFGR